MRTFVLVVCVFLAADNLIAEAGDSSSKWKSYSSNASNSVYVTSNWSNFDKAAGATPAYSFRYPSDWTLRSSVFQNSNGDKVAEFMPGPGLVLLKEGQECFDNYKEDPEGYSKIVKVKRIKHDGLHGKKLIEKTMTESIIWFPHWYCLSDGHYAFGIIFYALKQPSELEKLFDKIASTLRIEHP